MTRLPPQACPVPLDADLGDALAAGLFGDPPADLAAFEAAFVDLVEAADSCPERAWDRFYDATLSRVDALWSVPVRQGTAGQGTVRHGTVAQETAGEGTAAGEGTVATFSRIWARAAALARGDSVLDVGTCFGFLPLAWASRPAAPALYAADLSPASAALTARQARRLGRDVTVICADGTRLPLGDRAVSTVLAVHVLEHLPPAAAAHLLREALRVADRRVVVAVPVEPQPDPVFGHVQVFDLARLAQLGQHTGWHVSLADADGAWLVLDRPQA